MLKSFLLLSAAFLISIILIPTLGGSLQPSAQTPSASGARNAAKQASAEAQAKAKKLYAQECAMCHGDNGNGQTDLAKSMGLTVPNFTDPKVLAAKQDQELFDAVRKGTEKMPAEAEGRVGNTELWNIIALLREMPKSQPQAPAQ